LSCIDGVKFGAKFHPNWCRDGGTESPKLLPNFGYKLPTGAFPFAIFTKFAKFGCCFKIHQLMEFEWNLLRSYAVIGVLS